MLFSEIQLGMYMFDSTSFVPFTEYCRHYCDMQIRIWQLRGR